MTVLSSDMHEHIIAKASRLSDDALLARVEQLAAHAREASVELIAHLAEVERRRLYRRENTGSLYGYCRQSLRLSEHAAYHRMKVARAVLHLPAILDLLADGSVNLTTIRLLAPHLTTENHRSLLAEATGKSRREVQRIVARLAPQPDVRSSVRKLPAPRPAATPPVVAAPLPTALGGIVTLPEGEPRSTFAPVQPAGSATSSPASHRPLVEPLTPDRYRLQLTMDQDAHDDLRCLQDLLRREIPDGDPAVIVARALQVLRRATEKKAFSATSKPRPSRGARPRSRTIPAAVKRTVWRRDGGQCAFVGRNGRPCTERSYLEYGHIEVPHAFGGEATVENIALRCRAHNAYEAEVVFGSRVPSRANSVRTELTGGLPDFARTPSFVG